MSIEGETIKQLRKEREWSINELARRSGVASSQVSRFERGERKPSFRSLRSICGAFGISPEEFWQTSRTL